MKIYAVSLSASAHQFRNRYDTNTIVPLCYSTKTMPSSGSAYAAWSVPVSEPAWDRVLWFCAQILQRKTGNVSKYSYVTNKKATLTYPHDSQSASNPEYGVTRGGGGIIAGCCVGVSDFGVGGVCEGGLSSFGATWSSACPATEWAAWTSASSSKLDSQIIH